MLTGVIGNGLGLILAVVAILIARYRHDAPGRAAADILLTAAVVLMAFAGELSRSTGIGSWLTSIIHWGESMIGRDASTVVALITLAVFIAVARHIYKTASPAGMWLAFILPFLLATFPSGFFHQLDVDLQGPALELANQIAKAIGA